MFDNNFFIEFKIHYILYHYLFSICTQWCIPISSSMHDFFF